MSEPEDIIADAARHTLVAAQKLWRRGAGRQEGETLSSHRRRLELLIAAIHPIELPVRVAQRPAPPSFLRKIWGKPMALSSALALPATDGSHVFLPRALQDPPLPVARTFRLLALQQAGRAVRGSAGWAGPLEGAAFELYLMSDAFAVDRQIAQSLPGLAQDLETLRAALREGRPPLDKLNPVEQRVEALYREALSQPLGLPAIPEAASPEASRLWAETTAASMSEDGGRFRGLLHDLFLGELRPVEAGASPGAHQGGGDEDEDRQQRATNLARRPEVRKAQEDEDDGEPGAWMLQMDDAMEHVEDPMGMERPTDRDAGVNADDAADSLSELSEARVVSTPERAKEVFVSDDPPATRSEHAPEGRPTGIVYPEWDHRRRDYDPNGATVWVRQRPLGDPAWAAKVIEKRRPLLVEVRRRFERLRPRRMQLGRQTDGEELDLEACVEAAADRLAGIAADDRLYKTTRPRRRDLSVFLLVDVSGSTDGWVTEDLRIVDVEKEALLVCCQALDALGDPYAIEAFSGEGPHGVDIWTVKDFEERDMSLVQRRIADLEPYEYTRAGAAIRHATARLASRGEQHRLLLLISDGKPNDMDHYGGVYGVEDMRQAVVEATAAGIHSFCLTVDQDAPSYLQRIFGPTRHTTLAHARELPVALVEALRHLIR